MGGDLEFLAGIPKVDYTGGRVAGEPQYIIVVYGPEGMLDDTKRALEKFGFGGNVIQTEKLDLMKQLIRESQVNCAVYHALMEQETSRRGEVLALNGVVGKPVIRATLLEYGWMPYSPEQIAAERENFERELKEALQ